MASPHFMEQWFLDLDGVRSGPYQTPEIISLIAEGEVMPHHRISTSLKDQQWISILDWRLEQARKLNHFQSAEVVEQRAVEAVEFTIPEPPPPVVTPNVQPPPMEAKIPSFLTESEEEKDEPEVFLQPVPQPPAAPQEPKVEVESEPVLAPITPKRDATAEMFDILQTTRQKREAKSQSIAIQQANQAAAHPEKAPIKTTRPQPSKSWGKTVSTGMLIVAAGFTLGQVFQRHSGVPEKPLPEKTAAAPSTVVPEAKPNVEIIDRSTEKMVIRSRVEHKEAQVRSNAPVAKNETKGKTEKEIQELKDLKKELQELKALKEELKTGGSDVPIDAQGVEEDDVNNPDAAGMDPSYNYYPPTGGAYPHYPNPSQGPQNNNVYPPPQNGNTRYPVTKNPNGN